MSNKNRKQTIGSVKIHISKTVQEAIAMPKGWFTRLFWRWIKLDLSIVDVPNPIIVALRRPQPKLFSLIPRVKNRGLTIDFKKLPKRRTK